MDRDADQLTNVWIGGSGQDECWEGMGEARGGDANLSPILHRQSRHAREFADIAGDHDEVTTARVGRD